MLKTLDELLRSAIVGKRLVQLRYSGSIRVVEPHDYGVKNGSAMLLAYQQSDLQPGEKIGHGLATVRCREDRRLHRVGDKFKGSRGASHQHHHAGTFSTRASNEFRSRGPDCANPIFVTTGSRRLRAILRPRKAKEARMMGIEQPLAVQLRKLWARVETKEITSDAAMAEQERLLAGYREIWREALLMKGERDLTHSTLAELATRNKTEDLASVRARCEDAVKSLKKAWDKDVKTVDTPHVERFYDRTELFIDELMWWHTLKEDDTPLAYVAALKFAEAHGAKTILDFGSGVGSGGLLYVRHGFDVTLADISSVLLDFCVWRFKQRGLVRPLHRSQDRASAHGRRSISSPRWMSSNI